MSTQTHGDAAPEGAALSAEDHQNLIESMHRIARHMSEIGRAVTKLGNKVASLSGQFGVMAEELTKMADDLKTTPSQPQGSVVYVGSAGGNEVTQYMCPDCGYPWSMGPSNCRTCGGGVDPRLTEELKNQEQV